MKPTLVLLAAGIGSRYGGLKQVDAVGPSGETIMDYSIYDALRSGFGDIVFVIRKDIEQDFRNAFTDKLEGRVNFRFAYQESDLMPEGFTPPPGRVKPWGTGHAVLAAAPLIRHACAVINADDFYGHDAYLQMAGFLGTDEEPNQYAMVGYDLNNTLSDHGYVSRGICRTDQSGKLISITERTRIMKTHGQVAYQDEKDTLVFTPRDSLVSMNFWGFRPSFFNQLEELWLAFLRQYGNDMKAEFYLSSAIDTLIQSGQAAITVLRTTSHWFGVTYKEDKPVVIDRIRALVKAGYYPPSLWKQ